MAMIEDICNIVEDIVSSIDTQIVGVNTGNGTADFCHTKWARKGKTLTRVSDGEQWTIDEVILDESITAIYIGTTIPEPIFEGTFELPTPFFITGTRLATNSEWTKASNDITDKTPIVWLLETTRERIFGREQTLERASDLRMFFLDETNVKDYYTKDHRVQVVQPMTQLVEGLIETISAKANFDDVEEFQLITFSRFGVEQETGFIQNIIDANLSGVELQFTLQKFKENCKC
jgi:hypothetical protein